MKTLRAPSTHSKPLKPLEKQQMTSVPHSRRQSAAQMRMPTTYRIASKISNHIPSFLLPLDWKDGEPYSPPQVFRNPMQNNKTKRTALATIPSENVVHDFQRKRIKKSFDYEHKGHNSEGDHSLYAENPKIDKSDHNPLGRSLDANTIDAMIRADSKNEGLAEGQIPRTKKTTLFKRRMNQQAKPVPSLDSKLEKNIIEKIRGQNHNTVPGMVFVPIEVAKNLEVPTIKAVVMKSAELGRND